MNNMPLINLVVGAASVLAAVVSGAFVIYWHVFAKKHLIAYQQEKTVAESLATGYSGIHIHVLNNPTRII